MEDWNDARLVLAVARAGGLVAAAKALRVDHSTVFRRLSALEARLGPLFERGPGGIYRPTPAGLRASRPREGDLWGRKLADIAWTAYGSPALLAAGAAVTGPADLARHKLIGWDEGTRGINAADWLAESAPASAVVYRTGSLINQF